MSGRAHQASIYNVDDVDSVSGGRSRRSELVVLLFKVLKFLQSVLTGFIDATLFSLNELTFAGQVLERVVGALDLLNSIKDSDIALLLSLDVVLSLSGVLDSQFRIVVSLAVQAPLADLGQYLDKWVEVKVLLGILGVSYGLNNITFTIIAKQEIHSVLEGLETQRLVLDKTDVVLELLSILVLFAFSLMSCLWVSNQELGKSVHDFFYVFITSSVLAIGLSKLFLVNGLNFLGDSLKETLLDLLELSHLGSCLYNDGISIVLLFLGIFSLLANLNLLLGDLHA